VASWMWTCKLICMTPKETTTTISTRVSEEVDQRFDQLAAYHQRSKSSEVFYALMIFDMLATLDSLDSAEEKARMSAAERRKAKAEVERDLKEAKAAAFRRPDPVPPLHEQRPKAPKRETAKT
jgi:predicted transcriptional regulator